MTEKFIIIDRQTAQKTEYDMLHRAMLAAEALKKYYVFRQLGEKTELVCKR